MTIQFMAEKLLKEGEWFDITADTEEVWAGVKVYVVSHLHETLSFYSPLYDDASIFTALVLEIDAAIKAGGNEDIPEVTDINGFIAEWQDIAITVEIFDVPGFYVYVYPIPQIKGIWISEANKFEPSIF